MATAKELREAIKRIAENEQTDNYWAVVKSVNTENETCVVEKIKSGLVIEEISMSINKNGVVIIPAVGSKVIVQNVDGSKLQGFLLFVELIDSITIRYNESILIGGDNFGGLTKTLELKENLQKNNNLIEALIHVINGAPVPEPGNGSPSALQTALKSAIAGKTLGDFSNIENERIKHG